MNILLSLDPYSGTRPERSRPAGVVEKKCKVICQRAIVTNWLNPHERYWKLLYLEITQTLSV